MDGTAAQPAEGWQHRAPASIACLWVVVASQTILSALHSDWPAPPQLPTAEQVQAARSAAWGAAAVAVVLMFAVPGSGILLGLTGSPVRHG